MTKNLKVSSEGLHFILFDLLAGDLSPVVVVVGHLGA